MHVKSAIFLFVTILSVAICSTNILTSLEKNSYKSDSDASSNTRNAILFWQNELAATTAAQQAILRYISHIHLVPIGTTPRSLSHLRSNSEKEVIDGENEAKSRIVMSTRDNNIECRISLGRAPIGSKCVSPCGCTGSQKWIQFKELNKLRRKDPLQWTVCQTCQQKFEYDIFTSYGGLMGNLIGMVLDNTNILRTSLFAVTSVLAYTLSLNEWIMRLLVSRPVWQMYMHWSKITHLPLALKFWFGKIVFQMFADNYIALERNIFLSYLVDIETGVIESKLPVAIAPRDELDDYDTDSDKYDNNDDNYDQDYSSEDI